MAAPPPLARVRQLAAALREAHLAAAPAPAVAQRLRLAQQGGEVFLGESGPGSGGEAVLEALTRILGDLRQQMDSGGKAVLRFWTATEWNDVVYDEAAGCLKQAAEAAELGRSRDTRLVFPSARTGKRFQTLVTVMMLCRDLIRADAFKTLRDVYYMDVAFFRSQNAVDLAALDLSCLLQKPRSEFHLLTSSRGWLAGELRLRQRGVLVDCRTQIVPIPPLLGELDAAPVSAAEFILVVEKDAVFQQLVSDGFAHRCPCILLTGRGYPDVSTRAFLKWLVDRLLLPSFALVDADPHGFEIMTTYCVGSRTRAHEVQNLAVPSLRWLGLLPSDIVRYHVPAAARLPLTPDDTRKLRELQSRDFVAAHPAWKRELETMVALGVKAEVEGLQDPNHGFRYLTDHFLIDKLHHAGWAE